MINGFPVDKIAHLFVYWLKFCYHFSIQDEGEDEDDDTPNGDISAGKDLISESDINSIRDPVEDRLTLAEKNERLQNQLKVRVQWRWFNFFMGWIWIFWFFH